MKIYKITKPSDPMTVYIGKTSETLIRRMQKHNCDNKLYPHRKVYQWYDSTCKIELIEICNSNPEIREMEVVQEYIANGYVVMNTQDGRKLLNPITYEKGKRAERNPDYHNWGTAICRKAKKEGLTSKEYRVKYNIPDYTGPKTI